MSKSGLSPEGITLCGLVFMGTKYPGLRDIEIFEELLFADTFRGPHSTGVCSLFHKPAESKILRAIRKDAVPGPDFISSALWEAVSKMSAPGLTKNSTIITRPYTMFGHNRWATKGAINAKNAHPFLHGHITLAHNGTLTNQSLLPDHKDFEVDSENIAHAISKEGIEATVKKLDGAFTLIWHDAELGTVNILRNNERPFHLVETTSGDWFGASEEQMLMWILKRQKIPVNIKRHFECEPGTQYVFDVSTGRCVFKEEVKHELPKFVKRYTYVGQNWTDDDHDYNSWWDARNAVSNPPVVIPQNTQQNGNVRNFLDRETLQNNMLRVSGLDLKVGDRVTFIVNDWVEYASGGNYLKDEDRLGKITGYAAPSEDFIEIESNGIRKGVFTQYGKMSGKILSCRHLFDNSGICVFVGDIVNVDELNENQMRVDLEDTDPNKLLDEVCQMLESMEVEENEDYRKKTLTGEDFSKKEWSTSYHSDCCSCGSPISFEEVPKTKIINGFSFCPVCAKDADNIPFDEPAGESKTFICRYCSKERDESLKGSSDNLCIRCDGKRSRVSRIEVKSVNKVDNSSYQTLTNGMKVSLATWNIIHKCKRCEKVIPWEDASNCKLIGGVPLCNACEKLIV